MNEDLQRLWIRLTTDRRKFGAMCTLAVVGLLLWARLLLLNDVPRTGLANPTEAQLASASSAGSTQSATMRAAIENAPVVYLDGATTLARNFFAAPDALFSQPEQPAEVDDPPSKSQDNPPEDQWERQRLRVESDAAKLRLDSLILGAAPAAVINARVVREGGQIDGFVLERVLKRSVILVKDQVRVEVKMDTPGR